LQRTPLLDVEIAQINFKVFAEGRKIKLYLFGSAITFPQNQKLALVQYAESAEQKNLAQEVLFTSIRL
jgi:hypothetical protein